MPQQKEAVHYIFTTSSNSKKLQSKVKWFKKISNAQSLIKPAGGNLSLITASLLLTALTATQPAGKSNGHLNSRSISRPVSLVWLGHVPWCQPVCWCRRSALAIYNYSSFKSQWKKKNSLMRSNSQKWQITGSCGSSQPLQPAPALFIKPIPNILSRFCLVFFCGLKWQIKQNWNHLTPILLYRNHNHIGAI